MTPLVNMQRVSRDSSRPNAIDEHAVTVSRSRRLVRTAHQHMGAHGRRLPPAIQADRRLRIAAQFHDLRGEAVVAADHASGHVVA